MIFTIEFWICDIHALGGLCQWHLQHILKIRKLTRQGKYRGLLLHDQCILHCITDRSAHLVLDKLLFSRLDESQITCSTKTMLVLQHEIPYRPAGT